MFGYKNLSLGAALVLALSACDGAAPQQKGGAGGVANLDSESQVSSDGVMSVVQPMLPDGSEREAASLALQDDSASVTTPAIVGLPSTINMYIYEGDKRDESKLVRKISEVYIPGKRMELRGLPPGTYLVRMEIGSSSFALWEGESIVEVKAGVNAPAEMELKRKEVGGIDLVIKPFDGGNLGSANGGKCSMPALELPKLGATCSGLYSCEVSVPKKDSSETVKISQLGLCGEDRAKANLLFVGCLRGYAEDAMKDVVCKKVDANQTYFLNPGLAK